MKVIVWFTTIGHKANSVHRAIDLPMCPGPGWWIDIDDLEDSFRVDEAGVDASGAWVEIKVDDVERYREWADAAPGAGEAGDVQST